ncbi:copper resistance protein [Actinoplanes awajinensis subsp. mycoplanecinus]|uniref:Copper resistance protein n=2 Tax=Actinoplanes awajinensis TaxID=135946 RepID=A0A117MRH6_9ACTN|nr:copper resistance protein [Actinoplanes awajinensis subsp. mycoplanecinus]
MLSSPTWRRGLLAGAAVTATLVLSACGGDDTAADSGMNHGGTTPATAASAATFTDADVTFAGSMIPHHQQAVQMAALADGRAGSSEVKDLAATIKAAQQPEIDTMSQWLTAWGHPMPAMSGSVMPGMDASVMPGMDHDAMPGAMSPADMDKLTTAKGAAFDKQFLTLMISHHEGAVTMAQQEVAQGTSPEAKTLAQKIITDQQAEITEMKGLLGKL